MGWRQCSRSSLTCFASVSHSGGSLDSPPTANLVGIREAEFTWPAPIEMSGGPGPLTLGRPTLAHGSNVRSDEETVPNRADESFGDKVRPGSLNRGSHNQDNLSPEDLVGGSCEFRVSVVDEKSEWIRGLRGLSTPRIGPRHPLTSNRDRSSWASCFRERTPSFVKTFRRW